MGIVPVVFIAFMGSDNHGIGYMRSFLLQAGFKSRVLDLQKGKKYILRKINELDPEIIGLSVIFQSHINEFVEVAGFLRKNGIKCHFTAGGHYASLKYTDLFKAIPSLDSIVRFEGEYTILELAKSIILKTEWRKIDGLVYVKNHKIIKNALRPAEKNLDRFPFPLRPPLKRFAFNLKFTAIIAGRGCLYNCSFCNTQEYYHQMKGPKKRMRKPEMVVNEIEYLHRTKKCSIFLFDDDDFPVTPKKEKEWIKKFCRSLTESGLVGKILWKINCRPDEVDEQNFRLMKKHGLFHVFVGIEDGTDTGLERLNKSITSIQNLKSIKILKKLKIGFDFGFMLFQPDTTFESLNDNLQFLTKICGDGYSSVTFNKLLPLYETKVEKDLLKEGRLKEIDGRYDYDFLEDSMTQYYNFINGCFKEWLGNKDGVENISKWARSYFLAYTHFFETTPEIKKYYRRIKKIISESNMFTINMLRELAENFKTGKNKQDDRILNDYREYITAYHDYFKNRVKSTMAEFLDVVFLNSFLITDHP